MSIFGRYAEKYLDAGFSVIPIKPETKVPLISNWSAFCSKLPTSLDLEIWCKNYPEANIGLCLGPASNLIAFDWDYDYDPKKCGVDEKTFLKDKKYIELNFMKDLPPSPYKKTGRKGFTNFYRYSSNLTNLSCDRNGVRAFDLLVTGRQTIIPPSVHPETKTAYTWLGEDLLFSNANDFEELPCDFINDLFYYLSDKQKEKDNSRHGVLLRYIISACSIYKDIDRVVDATVLKDKELNKDKSYFKDPKYNMRGLPERDFAKPWVERVIKWSKQSVATGSKKKQAVGYESFKMFFDEVLKSPKKCIISGVAVELGNNNSVILNRIDTLQSIAQDYGLKPVEITRHLSRYVEELKPGFLVDIPEWDGVDRIKEICSFIKLKDASSDQLEHYLKYWISGVFKRMYDPSFQNIFIIIRGDQGIGKDHLIKTMFAGFRPYFSNFAVQPNREVDTWHQVASSLILHLEEFDQATKLGVPFLKELITTDFKAYRLPYERLAANHRMVGSFISTANIDNIFSDSTGNRRFAVFDVESIDWNYPKNLGLQVIAQGKKLFESGYVLPKCFSLDMVDKIKSLTPIDMEEPVIEIYQERASLISLAQGRPHLRFSDIMPVLNDLSKTTGWSLRAVLSLLKRKGFTRRDKKSSLYLTAPNAPAHKDAKQNYAPHNM